MGCFRLMALAAFSAVVSTGIAFAATVNNPIMYVDSPDPSIVRVDDAYYMVTTTMHFAPGVPVFKSTDRAQWRTVGYAYQTLTNNNNMNLNNADAYGKGSWASSIRYHKGFFYVLTPSYTTNKTHLYKTADVENGPWSEVTLPFYHDPSLFFDDDGPVWMFYGSGDQISYVQLNDEREPRDQYLQLLRAAGRLTHGEGERRILPVHHFVACGFLPYRDCVPFQEPS